MKKTPLIMIERGADLWCRKLSGVPVHDNGDASRAGASTQILAGLNAIHARDKVANYPETVEKFRKLFIERITAAEEAGTYVSTYHRVDYNPDRDLAELAEAAGVPLNQFPWKSSVDIEDDCVMTSFGYGAPRTYHYLLPDGSGWLMTQCRLVGDDGVLIMAAVLSGAIKMTVEPIQKKPE